MMIIGIAGGSGSGKSTVVKAITDQLKENVTVIPQDAYYKDGKPLVSDLEYDRAWDRLLQLEKENPELALPDSPTKRVGSDLTNDFPEFEHSIPVLSLDKAYSKEEVLSFFSKSIQNFFNSFFGTISHNYFNSI